MAAIDAQSLALAVTLADAVARAVHNADSEAYESAEYSIAHALARARSHAASQSANTIAVANGDTTIPCRTRRLAMALDKALTLATQIRNTVARSRGLAAADADACHKCVAEARELVAELDAELDTPEPDRESDHESADVDVERRLDTRTNFKPQR